MPGTSPRKPRGLPAQSQLNAAQKAELGDTPTHAAVTALVVAGSLCLDPVRARNARSLFSLVADTDADGGDASRRRAGMVVALVDCAVKADPACAELVLALERWLLHPGGDNAAELTAAAAGYTAAAAEEPLRRAWVAGAGLDAAVEEIVTGGLHAASLDAIAAVREACDHIVPLVWVAQRCGVSRDALRQRTKELAAEPDDGAS